MNTLKKLTALLLTFILATASVPAIFAGEIDCDGFYFNYLDDLMIYSDYSKVVEEMKKYAKKGDVDKVNDLFTKLIDLQNKYQLLSTYTKFPERENEHMTIAECEFDKATGTIHKVLNDGMMLYVPAEIDGVPVTYIAEGAISDKKELYMLFIPPTIEVIDSAIVKNCPQFADIYNMRTPLTAVFFENCPSFTAEEIELTADSTVSHLLSADRGSMDAITLNLGMGFAIDSGIIKGDEKGRYNWENSLTRAEATIMLLRLMGLEAEAGNYSSAPCAFTDVPDWARGYINLAVEKGIVKGRSENYFGSSEPCSAADYLTMLFRLTDLKEGTDYSWQTIVNDYYEALITVSERLNYARRNLSNKNGDSFYHSDSISSPEFHASAFTTYYYSGGKFTRHVASVVTFYMLDIIAGENDLSFADILSERYNMPDYILFNYYARRSETSLPKNADKFNSFNLAICFSDNEKAFQFAKDSYKLTPPSSIDPEIKTLAESISAGKNTEYEKAKAISKWISEHIYYDHDYYEGRKKELFVKPKDVLQHRYTICSGYAALTKAMLESIGIECYSVSSLNHAWNIARLDGKAVLIDNTWDSPLKYINGKFYKEFDISYDSGTIAKNITEPGAKWYNEYFDAEPEDFYKVSGHKPVRNPRLINSYNNRPY